MKIPEESYGKVPYVKVKNALEQIKKDLSDVPEKEIDITFEYLVGSFFPEIMTNINEEMRRQHTLGYMEGLKDGQGEKSE